MAKKTDEKIEDGENNKTVDKKKDYKLEAKMDKSNEEKGFKNI